MRALVLFLLLFVGCSATGISGVSGKKPLLVGSIPVSSLTPGTTRLFLAYPSANFDFPEQLFGVYLRLEQPISAEQSVMLRDHLSSSSMRMLYVEVLSLHKDSPDIPVRLHGHGEYPRGIFKHFKSGDLNSRNYQPFEIRVR